MRAGSSTSNFDDALALVKMAADPSAVQTALAQLKAARTEFDGLATKAAQVSALEADLKRREEALKDGTDVLVVKQGALKAAQELIDQQKQALAATAESHAKREHDLAAGEAALSAAQAQHRSTVADATRALDARERAVSDREEEVTHREAALDARYAKLKELVA